MGKIIDFNQEARRKMKAGINPMDIRRGISRAVKTVVDEMKKQTVRNQRQHTSNTSLTNLAAIQVFLNRGKVYLQDRETLPLPYEPVNALFRY